MKSSPGFVIALAAAWFGAASPRVRAQSAPAPVVRATLLVEPAAIAPGETFYAGILLEPPPGWHTYWLNPGDAGEATSVEWRLPPGFAAGALEWPHPARFAGAATVDYGYEGAVLLLARLRPPSSLPPRGAASLAVKVRWLACREICIPGEAVLQLAVPVAARGGAPAPRHARRFVAARARLPAPESGWRARARRDGDTLALELAPPGGVTPGGRVLVFPEPASADALADALPTVARIAGGRLTLRLKRPVNAPIPARLVAVLVRETGWRRGGPVAWRIDVPVEGALSSPRAGSAPE